MEFEFEGRDSQDNSSSLVPTGGQFPYFKEVRTSQLLDFLQTLIAKPEKNLRKRINSWLYTRTRPGFHVPIKPNLHLSYLGQPNGHGTQHWWRLSFDEQWKQAVEQVLRGTALTVSGQNASQTNENANVNPPMEWGGLYFRSKAEIKIAEELDKREVLFFANSRGRVGRQGSPVSDASGWLTGRIEIDFLVFYKHKCMSLEVDGQHHQEGIQTIRDYVRDRVLLREGIPTVRFTAQECLNQPTDVVTEFLNMF